MKNIFYYMAAGALILTGCNDEIIQDETFGSLALDLSCKTEYVENEMTTKAALTDDQIINDLTVDIERPADGWKKQYKPFSTIKGTIINLGSGVYNLTASSPVKEIAAFDQPIYEGSQSIQIKTNQVTNASIICKITNMKVSLNLSEEFYTELSDFTITVSNGSGNLTWQKNPTIDDFELTQSPVKKTYAAKKAGYFTVNKLTVTVTGHRAVDNNAQATTTFYIDNVAAAQHHILNLNAKVTGQLGGLTITLDHTVKDVTTNIVVPGFDEKPINPTDPKPEGPVDPAPKPEVPATTPTVTWAANPTFAPMPINDTMNADLVIEGKEGITEFKVTVNSAALTPAIQGLTSDKSATMDLIGDAALIGKLANMAPTLPTGSKLTVSTPIDFKLTSLLQLINLYGPTPGDQHIFTLDLADKKGQKLNKVLTFVTE